MDHRMRLKSAPICLLLIIQINCFTPGIDGPITNKKSLEGGDVILECDVTTATPGDELMLLVWYKNDTPIYSYDARIGTEWSSEAFNTTNRLTSKINKKSIQIKISSLKENDEDLYHCRVDYLITPTVNTGVNLTVIVLPSQPFFLDEIGNKVVDKIGPYHEGDTLVLSCLVIGGRPSPHVSWYSGDVLVDDSDGPSDIPGVKENELYLPLTREHTAPLVCKASNTHLSSPITSSLEVEIYFSAENVSISWLKGANNQHVVQAGQPAIARCMARGSYPSPDISWWLGYKHLTEHSNHNWDQKSHVAISVLKFVPTIQDNGATLSCIATNVAMAPSRGSKADVVSLNVTYSPIVEVVKISEDIKDIIELDPLHLECEIKANPAIRKITWYFNDTKIIPIGVWSRINVTDNNLIIIEANRNHSGQYSCSAENSVGETRAHYVTVTVLYPPECAKPGVTMDHETLFCKINSLPTPDTYFWHIQALGSDIQQLTTGSALLPLSQLVGSLSGMLHVACEAANGIASQEKMCERTFSLVHLRPPIPQQCDLAFEDSVFKIRCIPVENATYYEVSVWKMSSTNASLVLERQGVMGAGPGTAMAHGAGPRGNWLVRGELGKLREGDEAGAAACNRYGCSRALLLRPTETLLKAAAPPWWNFILEKDVGIALGAVILVAAFVISTVAVRKLVQGPRRPKPPVIQVLQLDEVAREYLDSIECKHIPACSVRSCSSGYSGGSLDSVPPSVDRQRKPPVYFWDPGPPPDVTLTLSRESAV